VVFPDGQTEVLPTPVAIRRAKEMNLDLVLVSPTAEPPVAKIMDYGEYAYQQKKRQHEAKKKQHIIEVKEVKFRPNTDDHDYGFKKNHAIRFLQDGNKVKATVWFRGREITHAELGQGLLEKLVGEVAEWGQVEGRPRLEGRAMHVIIAPKKAR
jgi:translation initiation factor IF-3